MRNVVAVITLAVALFAIPAHAQDQDQSSTFTLAQPSGCGRAHVAQVYCYGMPTNFGGTFFLDTAVPAVSTHFILFSNVLDISGLANVTSATATYVTFHGYQVIDTLDITFAGHTSDGDNDPYTGTGHFTFTYYYGSCSGRGCGVPLSTSMATGTLTITYN